jgi:hypothetical protein
MYKRVLVSVNMQPGPWQPFKLGGFRLLPEGVHFFMASGLFPPTLNDAGQPDFDGPCTAFTYDDTLALQYHVWMRQLKLHFATPVNHLWLCGEHLDDITMDFVRRLADMGY